MPDEHRSLLENQCVVKVTKTNMCIIFYIVLTTFKLKGLFGTTESVSKSYQNLHEMLQLHYYCFTLVLLTIQFYRCLKTHTVYLSSSLYIINQKPMIPRTHFIVYPHEFHALLGEIRSYICLFCGFGLRADGAIIKNKFVFLLQDQTVPYSSWQARENIFLHKNVSIYKVYSII